MELFLIDAIGPFFRDYESNRINWSKIPFTHLRTEGEAAETQWEKIRSDLRDFAAEVKAIGYNAVTLDDLAHLATHTLHEPEIAAEIAFYRKKFAEIFTMLTTEFQLQVYLTSDIIPLTPAIDREYQGNPKGLEDYYISLVQQLLDDFPQLSGLILRIGESDGNDVKDLIRTRLHLRNPKETNSLLRKLLPHFDTRGKKLILRTWTVGAHRIGDLIWHRGTLADTLRDIDSPNFIVSMKHGESDFFRFIPINRAFFRVKQAKIIELQGRREYEGAGEYPSFIGRDCEQFVRELEGADNVVGLSMWCQTGGWHRFRRLPFLRGNKHPDIWIRLNVVAAIRIFKDGKSVEEAVETVVGSTRAPATLELLRDADTLIHELLYIEDFARQKLFFRRVRIPPLVNICWDCLFINHAVSKILRHFVPDPEGAIRSGEGAMALFPKMIRLARDADLPVQDIEHMRDFFALLVLARRYYFLPFDEKLAETIRSAKKTYKQRYPKSVRDRYRIKISFDEFKNFRCFETLSLEVPEQGAVFTGDNAQGKTTILEAVCTLIRLHSPRTNRFNTLTRFSTPGFGIAGDPWNQERKIQQKSTGFMLKCEGEIRKSRTGYLADGGLIVWMGNEDLNLIRGPGEARRHFLDFIGAQLDPKYRTAYTRYRRALKAKNLLLKEPKLRLPELIAWEDILIEHGTYLTESRSKLVSDLSPLVSASQIAISGTNEALTLQYLPASGPSMKDSIQQARQRETATRQAVIGPHRDDLSIRLHGMRASDYASEGQQRTIALALKLAQGEILQQRCEKTPIYLLDDIFGELDIKRRNALFKNLPENSQKWITTTNLNWLDTTENVPKLPVLTTLFAIILGCLPLGSLSAEINQDRKSLLDADPEVIYLEQVVTTPIKLEVIKEAPVFSDKDGRHRLGYLKADQTVELEGMTGKAYRVRGQGTRHGIAGWVAPWAFSHPEEDFVAKLEQLYNRQIAVNKIISEHEIAIGMTPSEVSRSRGEPTKTTVRRTADGEEGTWEFIDYEEVKHYVTRVDQVTGQVFRQFSHITREEKGKTTVEFKDGAVTAIQESEDRSGGNVKIVVPPIIYRW
eukprot:g4192.t1